MSALDYWSFAATIASLVLAIVAICLSILFYILSTKESKETTKAAESIDNQVAKLQELFERMYDSAFSEMRETHSKFADYILRRSDLQGGGEENQPDIFDGLSVNKEDIAKEVSAEVLSNLGEVITKDQANELIDEAIGRALQKEEVLRRETNKTELYNDILGTLLLARAFTPRRALSVADLEEEVTDYEHEAIAISIFEMVSKNWVRLVQDPRMKHIKDQSDDQSYLTSVTGVFVTKEGREEFTKRLHGET